MSIKTKIVLMLLTVSITSIMVIGYLGYRSGRDSLRASIENQLIGLSEVRTRQIQGYFERIDNQLGSLANDPTVVQAMVDFRDSFKALEDESLVDADLRRLSEWYQFVYLKELKRKTGEDANVEFYLPESQSGRVAQHRFIAANSYEEGDRQMLTDTKDGTAYSKVHAHHHPFFRDFADRFGYYDLFLVEPERLEVVYSVFKESDFGTDLRDGPYRTSGLARAAKAAKGRAGSNAVTFVDFSPYRPSYYDPAAFLAMPLEVGSELIGILVLQISIIDLNRIMTDDRHWQSDGLGKTGESILVGADYLARSAARPMIEDPRRHISRLIEHNAPADEVEKIRRHQTTILAQKIKNLATVSALSSGQSGVVVVRDYRDQEVLASYRPVDVPGARWAVLAQMDLDEALAPVTAFARSVIQTALAIVIAVTIIAMILAWLFERPIARLTQRAQAIAEGGEEVPIEVTSKDELGRLSVSFNQMVRKLKETTETVRRRNAETENLISSIFPPSVAHKIRQGDEQAADQFEAASLVVADVIGFTGLLHRLPAKEFVQILDDLMSRFDEATERHAVEKIKTLGSGYLAVAGVPTPKLDHVRRAFDFAAELVRLTNSFARQNDLAIRARVFVDSGPIVAGVVGKNRVVYDVWGDVVNKAFRSLSSLEGKTGVFVSKSVASRLEDLHRFQKTELHNQESVWLFLEELESKESRA
ncbi:MAG: adenylate/guanylate cyclase domain-containing protein [Planctomycetota bacterium]